MKGYRTLAVNVIIAIVGVLTAFNWADVLDPKWALLVTTVVIPMVNVAMRAITTTAVGKAS